MITSAEVRARLDIQRDALRKLMADTCEGKIRRPWVNIGSKAHPVYRWNPGRENEALWAWLQEVEQWRTTRNATVGGPSAGTKSTEPTGAGKSPTPLHVIGSSGKSSKPSRKGGGGSRTPAEIRRSRK